MGSDVYQKLQAYLDRLPMGFPKTESGVELEILQKLFTPEEAEIACTMGLKPEPAEAAAQRLGKDADAMRDDLMEMSKKGLIFRTERDGRTMFSGAAFVVGIWEYHVKQMDREVSVDEALEIMDMCDREGLVLSPSNSQRPVAICACCSCCCDFLHSLKRFERPAVVVNAAFCAKVDPEACEGCETCVDRCQMEAIQMEDAAAVINENRCIGCGLCVSNCPTEALSLARRETAAAPPEHIGHFFKQLGSERGKM